MDVDFSGAEADIPNTLAHNLSIATPSPKTIALPISTESKTSTDGEKNNKKRKSKKNKTKTASPENSQSKLGESVNPDTSTKTSPSKPATVFGDKKSNDPVKVKFEPKSDDDNTTLEDSSPTLESSKKNPNKKADTNKHRHKHKYQKPQQEHSRQGKHTTFSS